MERGSCEGLERSADAYKGIKEDDTPISTGAYAYQGRYLNSEDIALNLINHFSN